MTHSSAEQAQLSGALKYFTQLCAIPHRSYHTEQMRAFLCDECERLGFVVRCDKAGNIYARSRKNLTRKNLNETNSHRKNPRESGADENGTNRPKVCLQAHYDMVGVGRASADEPLTLYEDGQYLRARESSLGADNGAAIAAILWLMEQTHSQAQDESAICDFEVLFTNDEEVGLCGANELTIPIESPFLLNLDSEFFGEIIVGCAGGFDMSCEIEAEYKRDEDAALMENALFIQVCAQGFIGGHSGVDIHKHIPSSIVEFFALFSDICEKLDKKARIYLLAINAGEKANSIPVGCEAQICIQPLESTLTLDELTKLLQTAILSSGFTINTNDVDEWDIVRDFKHATQDRKAGKRNERFVFHLDNESKKLYTTTTTTTHQQNGDSSTYTNAYDMRKLAAFVLGLKVGVRESLPHIVLSSLNLALATSTHNTLHFTIKARANTNALQVALQQELVAHAEQFCQKPATIYNLYEPWQRQLADNHPMLERIIKAFAWRHTEISEIHAGLECGILQQRFSQMGLEEVEMASIGPTILYPHSTKERLDVGSFEEFLIVLRNIMQTL